MNLNLTPDKIAWAKGLLKYESSSNKEMVFLNSGTSSPSRVRLATFEGLNRFTTARANEIEQLVALLIMRDLINPDNLEGAVVDFGTGFGAGAYILNQYGGTVTGVDSLESGVQRVIEEGILPADRALVKDGFEYLGSLQPASINFIGAFMMQNEFPHRKLYRESQRVLKPGGQLLITGGTTELKAELHREVGRYGTVEEVVTFDDTSTYYQIAFIYTQLEK